MTAPMWVPSAERVAQSPITRFRALAEQRSGRQLPDYAALHAWSVADREAFWTTLWDFAEVRAQRRGERVLINGEAMPGARFFPDARLNYAENLIEHPDVDPEAVAICFRGENGETRELSWGDLRAQVAALSAALAAVGVEAGDRVAAFMPNIPETVIAMLAATRLGATFSSCSPDFGINGVLDRFGQIEPKVLVCADGYHYNGRIHDSLDTASELLRQMNSVQQLIVVDHVRQGEVASDVRSRSVRLADLLERHAGEGPAYVAVPFDHPLYIMFSSGTTGKPKCIVHGTGGTLLQQIKEHRLHVGLEPGQRLFYFTTCGWMMWNWLVTALASRVTICLFDGSPFYPGGKVLFDYAVDAGFNVFGTSAKYIDACHKSGLRPRESHPTLSLDSILSTGSPLLPESYDYVQDHIGADICLSSISGGTDILSCFALGNATLPVYRGELQCLGLGMDVRVLRDDGREAAVGEKGELVCSQAFPSMPTGFFNDDDGSRYRAAYFERFPGQWCHGDYVSLTEHGGMIIYGRSDAVLNPGGVRIGTAEIYRQVEQLDEIVEALVIGQRWEGDVRVVLFVHLREGLTLDDELQKRIKQHIRTQCTPRHVPARIVAVDDIPRTRSGKIVELAVRKVVHGETIDNLEALANPEALDQFRNRSELAE